MTTTHYIWDEENDSYFMETDGDGNVTAVYTNEPVPYGRVISQRRGNATSFYHYDGQGSTRQLTDENGNVTDEYTYSAFGETVASTGTTTNPFRFMGSIGYYSNLETGDIYVRARNYNAFVARWYSYDPRWYEVELDPPTFTSDVALYIYCSNRPISLSDPSGLESCASAVIGSRLTVDKCRFLLAVPGQQGIFDAFVRHWKYEVFMRQSCCCCEYRQYISGRAGIEVFHDRGPPLGRRVVVPQFGKDETIQRREDCAWTSRGYSCPGHYKDPNSIGTYSFIGCSSFTNEDFPGNDGISNLLSTARRFKWKVRFFIDYHFELYLTNTCDSSDPDFLLAEFDITCDTVWEP